MRRIVLAASILLVVACSQQQPPPASEAKEAAPAAAMQTSPTTEAARRSSRGLDGVNFFVAAVQTGFGAFVTVYLVKNAWAPQAIGLLSDWFAGAHGSDAASLRWALLLLAPTGFWAVWHFLRALKTVAADMRRAEGA